QEGVKTVKPIPQLPESLASVEIQAGLSEFSDAQLEKLKWLHGIWQTRFVSDAATAKPILDWAEQNLFGFLDSGTAPLNYELISVQHDCFEALEMAAKYQRVLNLGRENLRPHDPQVFLDNPSLQP